MKEVSFNAPWGAPLILMTGVCIFFSLLLLLLGLMICSGSAVVQRFLELPMLPHWVGAVVVTATILASGVPAVFMVRGYDLVNGSLIIKRLGWAHRLELSTLTSAAIDPTALHGSLRLFGNGGFFSFTGWYRNKKFGVFRAYATDAKKTVVLRWASKTVVITPDDPQKFVDEVNSIKGLFSHET